MIEKRKSPRHKVYKAATIAFNRAAGIDCIVRNISDGGACLDVASPLGIPDAFELRVASDGTMRLCRVVWKTDRRIGVAFCGRIAA